MDIEFKIQGIGAVEAALNKAEINKAISRALNRSAKAGYTAGSKKIRETYNIKAKDLKAATNIKKSTTGRLEARIILKADNLPLGYFNPKQTRKGVTVKIKKNEGRRLVAHAFMGGYTRIKVNGRLKMFKSSEWGEGQVFIRKAGKGRQPFKMSTENINVPDLFNYKPIKEVVFERINKAFDKEFWHNYEYYLSKK